MEKRNVLVGYRLFFGLLALAAIGTQLSIQVHNGFSIINFFSYFTNLSNIFAAIVLLISASYLLSRRQPSVVDDIIRGTSVVCMAIVGIVFSVLLRDVDLGHLLPWVNVVLHYVMPIVVVLDWLFQPSKSKLVFGQIKYWLIFPAVYLVYSLARGAAVDFYAYPFFNPAESGGYGGVMLYCLAILVVFFFVSWVLMALGNRLKRSVR